MRRVTRAFALLGGLALSGLMTSQASQAADIEPVVEEPAGLGWYVSLFGGPKWGDGDVKVEWEREDRIVCLVAFCALQEIIPVIEHLGELRGEVDDGFIFGGTLGAQINENFRAEIEVSHASLDTESHATEEVNNQIYTLDAVDGVLYESKKHEDDLDELFILANLWFGFPMSSTFSPYFGGGVGVAHVDANFGVAPFATNLAVINEVSAKIDADDWALAYQVGAGLLIALSDHFAIDLGYRFKGIHNVELDDPEFCGGEECHPPVVDFKADDDFDIHEHVAQIGLIIGF